MAKIFPYAAYRYSEIAGPLASLVTQPYDKISPSMRKTYLEQSPYNLVRIILDEPGLSDGPDNNVYTRPAQRLKEWIESGILKQDKEPSLFAYFQEFRVPDTGEYLTRKGFMALGQVEDYSAGVIFRHEQTLSGPKKDRLELLRHTRTHCEQLFMLYPDPAGEIDRILDEVAQAEPDAAVTDEYGAEHRIWRISDPARISRIQQLMADKKLLIADGHHRYETAIAFRNENSGDEACSRVPMTFVNMHSQGLRILAAHRVVYGLDRFDETDFLKRSEKAFRVERIEGVDALRDRWTEAKKGEILFGVVVAGGTYLFTAKDPKGRLDVPALHEDLIGGVLGVTEEQVREGKHLHYIRGLDTAIEEIRSESAQVACLLRATPIEQVAEISFSGGVMPQKSTDFYPKLLSGLTIHKL